MHSYLAMSVLSHGGKSSGNRYFFNCVYRLVKMSAGGRNESFFKSLAARICLRPLD